MTFDWRLCYLWQICAQFEIFVEMWYYWDVFLRRSANLRLIFIRCHCWSCLWFSSCLCMYTISQSHFILGQMQERIKCHGSYKETALWMHVFLRTFILLTCALCCHGFLQSSHSSACFFLSCPSTLWPLWWYELIGQPTP